VRGGITPLFRWIALGGFNRIGATPSAPSAGSEVI
jgi:hypothetical protein